MHLEGSRRHVQTRKFQKLEATGFAVPTDYHYMIGTKTKSDVFASWQEMCLQVVLAGAAAGVP